MVNTPKMNRNKVVQCEILCNITLLKFLVVEHNWILQRQTWVKSIFCIFEFTRKIRASKYGWWTSVVRFLQKCQEHGIWQRCTTTFSAKRGSSSAKFRQRLFVLQYSLMDLTSVKERGRSCKGSKYKTKNNQQICV